MEEDLLAVVEGNHRVGDRLSLGVDHGELADEGGVQDLLDGFRQQSHGASSGPSVSGENISQPAHPRLRPVPWVGPGGGTGRRGALKRPGPRGRVGSSPTPGTHVEELCSIFLLPESGEYDAPRWPSFRRAR